MAKNEAKIKFTAETSEFNAAIKKSNDEMSELRAEMKLNEAQMDNTGTSVDGLKRKQKLLEAQLKTASDKTGALSKKLESAEKNFGKNSTEASKLRTQLSKAKTEEAKLERAVKDCTSELENFDTSMDNAGDAAKNASEGGFTVAKGMFSDLASKAIQTAIDKLSEFINYLKGLPEATRETRQKLAVLDTSFEQVGLTAEQGQGTVRELYGVFGDNDKAVEAATLFAKMSTNQEDLNKWVTISTGVYATYGDSLPVESLAESANETMKCGKVTGSFADVLNWSSEAAEMFSGYMSEDVTTAEDAFNVALSKCSTEQERQALIMETLTTLYGDSADGYKENAGSMIEANKAAYDLTQAEGDLGEAVEPVTTAWDGLKTTLLTAALPAVKSVCNFLLDAFTWLKEHPTVLKAVTAAFAALGIGLGILSTVWVVYTAVQLAANTAMLPIIGIAAAIVAGIALLIGIGVALYENWDTIKQWASTAWEAIKNAVSTAITAAKNVASKAMNAIKSAASKAFNAVKTTASTVWNAIKTVVSNAVNAIKTTATNVWNKLKTATSTAFNAVKTAASNAWNGIKTTVSTVVNGVKTAVSNAWNGIKTTTSNVFNGIKNTATRVWNGVKTAIMKPINSAKNLIKKAINAIKGFFKFKFSWPKIPMPHFGITPKGWKVGDLLQGTIPKLGITWYAEGGIMTKPTVFGVNGSSLMAGGEAGPEAILPISKLEGYIANAIEKRMSVVNLEALANSIEDLANRPIELKINGRQFAVATASDGDSVNGLRSTFRSRGLVLD